MTRLQLHAPNDPRAERDRLSCTNEHGSIPAERTTLASKVRLNSPLVDVGLRRKEQYAVQVGFITFTAAPSRLRPQDSFPRLGSAMIHR